MSSENRCLKQIRSFLKEINEEKGTTILLTSHYIEDIKTLCRRTVVRHGSHLYIHQIFHAKEFHKIIFVRLKVRLRNLIYLGGCYGLFVFIHSGPKTKTMVVRIRKQIFSITIKANMQNPPKINYIATVQFFCTAILFIIRANRLVVKYQF